MHWQWLVMVGIGAVPGFILGRWKWTLFLAPLPFLVFLGFYKADTFCQNTGGFDCLEGIAWGVISVYVSIAFAAGVVVRIVFRTRRARNAS